MADLSVGQRAPFFELPDQQDYPWSLSGQLEVGPAVLVFYRGDWSPYCNGQLANYARKYEQFERLGTQVAGISVDPPRRGAAMVGKLLIPFPLLSDPGGGISHAYGVWNEKEDVCRPSVVVVDRSGEVRYAHVGTDLADRPEDEDLFAALEALDERGAFGTRIERLTGGPELRTTASESRKGGRWSDQPVPNLQEILLYYRGSFSTTTALESRLGAMGRAGRKASREVARHQRLLRAYTTAVQDTWRLVEQQS